MQKTIRILMLLAVTMLAGSGVWAQDGPSNDPSNGEGDPLGMIYYDDQDAAVTTAGGLLEFFNNDACDFDSEGNYHLSAYENVPAEWLDAERTVYIKATPNAGHKLGAADAETHAVTFITVTEGAPVMNPNGARQMSRAAGALKARTRADGDAITVTLVRTDGQAGIYKFQMPAAVNGIASDVTVTAAFPEHTVAKLGDAGYEHITFIDYETDAQTGALTAVSRSTEDLKDANNQPVPVYVLDGTETTLGTAGTSESPTEAWYVCLTPATANNGKGLVYVTTASNQKVLTIADYCNVHLILADGCLMTVDGTATSEDAIGGSDFAGGLTIYGQGGTDATTNQSTEGALSITGKGCGIFAHGDLVINGGQFSIISSDVVALDAKDGIIIHGGQIIATGCDNAIDTNNSNVIITGGTVNVTATGVGASAIHSPNLYISGGTVTANGEGAGLSAVSDLTISGGKVTATCGTGENYYGIFSSYGAVDILGGQVEATSVFANGPGTDGYRGGVTLGWTAASDYIKAGSFTTTSGKVKTAGKRFVALDESAGEGLPTAKAIVPANATAGGGFELSDIEGQTLRPVDGYLLGLCPGLGVYRNGSAAPALEFTMAGDETTHYYIYKEDDGLTLSVGGVNDGFNGTLYKRCYPYEDDAIPVEVLQENPTDPTAMLTAYSGFNIYTHSMDMPAEDLKIAAYRAYRKDVKYLKDGSAKTPTNVPKAYILDGHDHTLYGGNGVWYILLATADETKGWMKDSEGNWMLTTNGNMFECRGSVAIVLTDGSALCVGTETNPFLGSAVIYGDYDLNFFTQSEPGIPLDENGNEMAYTDNRGRMEIYSSGAKAIHAERDITLTNVVLSGGKSPLDFKIYTNGYLFINGGQYDFVSFNSTKSIFFNPLASTDELYATSFSTDNDMINIADGKALADREYPTTALSGAVPATEAAGKKLTELKTISGATGQYLPPSGAAAAAAAAAAAVTATANMVMVGNTGGAQKLVATSGSAVKSCYVSDISTSGELELELNSAVVNGQPVDCSDLLLGSVVNKNADGSVKTNHSTVNMLTSEELLNAWTPGITLPEIIGTIGSGTDPDVLLRGAAAAQNVAKNGLQTLVAGDGANTNGELAAMGVEAEILRLIDAMKTVKSHYYQANVSDNAEAANAAHQQFKRLANEYMQKTKHTISQDPMEVDLNALPELAPAIAALATNQPLGSDATVRGREYFDHNSASWNWTDADGSGNTVCFKGGTVSNLVGGGSRTRASGGSQLTMTFVPVPYDKDKVLPKGEIRLFMTKAELLAIANYQRKYPDEVKKARARGALMIDTTTPETTAIIGRLMVTERAQPVDGHWYGLDGRRLPSAPTAKGVYVHRGRKVVIR
jgi:hypothetical protein